MIHEPPVGQPIDYLKNTGCCLRVSSFFGKHNGGGVLPQQPSFERPTYYKFGGVGIAERSLDYSFLLHPEVP